MAKENGKNVVFTGYISQEKMPEIYNIADVAVLPSMWEEPAGLTMIEAMACGTPVITTESGGIPEYVSNCAILVKRDKFLEKNLALHIEYILNNDMKNYEDGIDRVKELFSEDDYIDRFYNALKK